MRTASVTKYWAALLIAIIGSTYTTSSSVPLFSEYRAFADHLGAWGFQEPTPENAVSEGLNIMEFDWAAPTTEQLDALQNDVCAPAATICFVIVRSFGYTPLSIEAVRDGDYMY